MKKVVSVSLGSSRQDFEFKTKFLGQNFSVHRMGADQDTGKAWELMRRQQATADAIGLGEISDHYHVGQDMLINKETRRLTKVVTRVPVTTGATLRQNRRELRLGSPVLHQDRLRCLSSRKSCRVRSSSRPAARRSWPRTSPRSSPRSSHRPGSRCACPR